MILLPPMAPAEAIHLAPLSGWLDGLQEDSLGVCYLGGPPHDLSTGLP